MAAGTAVVAASFAIPVLWEFLSEPIGDMLAGGNPQKIQEGASKLQQAFTKIAQERVAAQTQAELSATQMRAGLREDAMLRQRLKAIDRMGVSPTMRGDQGLREAAQMTADMPVSATIEMLSKMRGIQEGGPTPMMPEEPMSPPMEAMALGEGGMNYYG